MRAESSNLALAAEHEATEVEIRASGVASTTIAVVAFRTFLRTLLHELCHHLDFEVLGLSRSFHTEGFFKRESSLFRQLVPSATEPQRASLAVRGRRRRV